MTRRVKRPRRVVSDCKATVSDTVSIVQTKPLPSIRQQGLGLRLVFYVVVRSLSSES